MKRIITNENFWTMNEEELEACIKAYKHNGWWYYTNSDKFDCQANYTMLVDTYSEQCEEWEENGDHPMTLEDYYFELVACGLGEE